MKQTITLILLSLIGFTLIAYIPFIKLIQEDIRHEIKQKIKLSVDESDLHIIRFKKTDKIYWTKPNKEFRYQGEMYDIVRQKHTAEEWVYYCIHDFKESKLFKNIDHYIAGFLTQHPQQQKSIHSLLQKIQLNYTFTESTKMPALWVSKYKPNNKLLGQYPSPFLEIKSPPPNSIL